MSRLSELLDYLRRQGPGPDEPDEMDAVQPADPVTDNPWAPVDPSLFTGTDDNAIEAQPVTIRHGRTYDEPVEGM